jgi:hypothetical protein
VPLNSGAVKQSPCECRESNLENLSQWDYGGIVAKQTSEGLIGVSSTFQTQRQFLGRPLRETMRISEFVLNSVMAFPFNGWSFSGQNRLTFEPVGDGTQMASISEIELSGWMKLAAPILPMMLGGLAQKNLANVKRILETTTL